jgi:hypothetical protein
MRVPMVCTQGKGFVKISSYEVQGKDTAYHEALIVNAIRKTGVSDPAMVSEQHHKALCSHPPPFPPSALHPTSAATAREAFFVRVGRLAGPAPRPCRGAFVLAVGRV